MKPIKHKKGKVDPENIDADIDDGRPVRFEALGELTSSEVIEQVKAGMSRISPDDDVIELASDEGYDELREDAA